MSFLLQLQLQSAFLAFHSSSIGRGTYLRSGYVYFQNYFTKQFSNFMYFASLESTYYYKVTLEPSAAQ